MPDPVSEDAARHQVQELVQRHSTRIQSLPDKPEETLEAVVRALWLKAAGVAASAEKALTLPLPGLNEPQQRQLADLLEQRARGVPLAHLTGRQQFLGLEFISTPQALIPRKETEILGNAALAILTEAAAAGNTAPRVLDLCTGSGNLACAVAEHFPHCTVSASDLSSEAVELARANARNLGVADRIQFFVGDLLAPFESGPFLKSFDLILCNPPYITSAKLPTLNPEIIGHEPKMAFDAGPLGLMILWRLIQEAPRFLKEDGWLAFEAGAGQSAGLVHRLSRIAHFAQVQGLKDGAGHVRAITARCSGAPLAGRGVQT
jgi:release factor glutamine methyltransferase